MDDQVWIRAAGDVRFRIANRKEIGGDPDDRS
jgi:hypothetical protein